jgi:hypothetical protein
MQNNPGPTGTCKHRNLPTPPHPKVTDTSLTITPWITNPWVTIPPLWPPETWDLHPTDCPGMYPVLHVEFLQSLRTEIPYFIAVWAAFPHSVICISSSFVPCVGNGVVLELVGPLHIQVVHLPCLASADWCIHRRYVRDLSQSVRCNGTQYFKIDVAPLPPSPQLIIRDYVCAFWKLWPKHMQMIKHL